MEKDHWQIATLAGGCFWCLEAVFKQLKGVLEVIPGYAGGHTDNPTYAEVSGGMTGYAETVQIKFDPALISYADLLDVFWALHDPTTLNRQGNDVGSQYRSVIFYADAAQKEIATNSRAELIASDKYKNPIVTEIVPLGKFYPAEKEHLNYYACHPKNGYCRLVIAPKIRKLFKEFPKNMSDAKIEIDETELKKRLTPAQYKVLRKKGTEAPFSSPLLHMNEQGMFTCAVCGNPLFSSDAKFDSGTGWPSFDRALPGGVELRPDNALGMKRTEVICARCGSHLGHVFDDNPNSPTGQRFCINGVCLLPKKK